MEKPKQIKKLIPLWATWALTTDGRQCNGCVVAIGEQLLCCILFFLVGNKQHEQVTACDNHIQVCDIITHLNILMWSIKL